MLCIVFDRRTVAVKLCSEGSSAIEDIQSLIVGVLRNDIWMFQCCFNKVMSKKTASVIYWSGFLATDTEVSGSIPAATRFSEWQWVWNGVHSAS